MAQTIALEGIISCSVFHFHKDGFIFRFHELRHPYVKPTTKIKYSSFGWNWQMKIAFYLAFMFCCTKFSINSFNKTSSNLFPSKTFLHVSDIWSISSDGNFPSNEWSIPETLV